MSKIKDHAGAGTHLLQFLQLRVQWWLQVLLKKIYLNSRLSTALKLLGTKDAWEDGLETFSNTPFTMESHGKRLIRLLAWFSTANYQSHPIKLQTILPKFMMIAMPWQWCSRIGQLQLHWQSAIRISFIIRMGFWMSVVTTRKLITLRCWLGFIKIKQLAIGKLKTLLAQHGESKAT